MFKEWPKTPRFFGSTLSFTEKIDGTNSCIIIAESEVDGVQRVVGVQSRNKLIKPDDDNMGFARWVHENHDEIVALLGVGYHYGEWWGQSIQRTYGMDRKVFSLFNAKRWARLNGGNLICDVVPSMDFELPDDRDGYTFGDAIWAAKKHFMDKSLAAEKYGVEFTNPEGFMMFHAKSGAMFKFPINK